MRFFLILLILFLSVQSQAQSHAVKEVDGGSELLIVPNILDVMVLSDIEVEPDSRKLSHLPARVHKRNLLDVWIASVPD